MVVQRDIPFKDIVMSAILWEGMFQICIEGRKKNVLSCEIILASRDDLPFKNNSFDKIIAVYSIVYSVNKVSYPEMI